MEKTTDFPKYWQIDKHSHLLIDKICHYDKNQCLPKQSHGSLACRQLLQYFCQYFQHYQLSLSNLNTSSFPYFYHHQQTQYFVSFSHSKTHIAVLISIYPTIGVDIEDRNISDNVAKRFFHQEEMVWLNSLSNKSLAKTLLWTTKESLIKANDSTLAKGLSKNVFKNVSKQELERLLFVKNIEKICQNQRIYGFVVYYHCAFIIEQS